MRKLSTLVLIISLISSTVITADNGQNRWKRGTETADVGLHLFRSAHALGLPTAETHQQGDFEFEISHRFLPAIKDGHEALYGFDGPAGAEVNVGD